MKHDQVSLRIFSFILFLGLASTAESGETIISHFNQRNNELGGRSSIYQRAPSSAKVTLTSDTSQDPGGKSLKLFYDKKGVGGPYGKGGWCGFYTQLKVEDRYYDASAFQALTFWVKGEKGEENFKVGMADQHWEGVGDSIKSEDIGRYLPSGNVAQEWQKATIPLEAFFLDHSELASIAFAFETDCFPGGEGSGVVYIDELAFE